MTDRAKASIPSFLQSTGYTPQHTDDSGESRSELTAISTSSGPTNAPEPPLKRLERTGNRPEATGRAAPAPVRPPLVFHPGVTTVPETGEVPFGDLLHLQPEVSHSERSITEPDAASSASGSRRSELARNLELARAQQEEADAMAKAATLKRQALEIEQELAFETASQKSRASRASVSSLRRKFDQLEGKGVLRRRKATRALDG